MFGEAGECRVAGAGGHDSATPTAKQSARTTQHHRIVVDDDNQLALERIEPWLARIRHLDGSRWGGRHRNRYGEARAFADHRLQLDGMLQKPAQTVDDGKPKAKPGVMIRFGGGKLAKLGKYILSLIVR